MQRQSLLTHVSRMSQQHMLGKNNTSAGGGWSAQPWRGVGEASLVAQARCNDSACGGGVTWVGSHAKGTWQHNIVRGVSLTTRTSCAKASESGWTWWAVGTGAGGGGGTANHCLPLTTMSPLVEESLGCVCALAATCCARTGKCACDREGGGGMHETTHNNEMPPALQNNACMDS
jgi:hypothetical protein